MKIIWRIIVIFGILLAIYTKSLATSEGTVRIQIVPSSNYWTNITVSDSYKKCEELNESISTLGMSNVKAHLTTDYDWSAMAIFSASQYGNISNNNNPTITTGNSNKSGIYNIGAKYVYTTGILSNATYDADKAYFFQDDHKTIKNNQYINIWNINSISGGSYPCIGLDKQNGTMTWLNSAGALGTSSTYPISVKSGLFGCKLGGWQPENYQLKGEANRISYI